MFGRGQIDNPINIGKILNIHFDLDDNHSDNSLKSEEFDGWIVEEISLIKANIESHFFWIFFADSFSKEEELRGLLIHFRIKELWF